MLRRVGAAERAAGARRGLRHGRNLAEFGALGGRAASTPRPRRSRSATGAAWTACARRAWRRCRSSDGEFDLILATDVLEHIERDDVAAASCAAWPPRRALLMVTVPAYHWLWSHHDDSHHHQRRYTRPQLRARLCARGLAAGAADVLQLAAAAADRAGPDAARAGRRRRQSDYELTEGPLNRALELPMRAEAALIGRGARFPAGVSIGMVCRPA